MAEDPDAFGLIEAGKTVAAWRGFALQARDIVNGRSIDWSALGRLRVTVMPLPVLGRGEPSPCRQLVELTGRMAVEADYRSYFHEVNDLGHKVLVRCAEADAGLAILRDMLVETGRAA